MIDADEVKGTWRALFFFSLRFCKTSFCHVCFCYRAMLYNGSDVIRDLEWVVFDEVHYINDSEVTSGYSHLHNHTHEHCHMTL